MVYIIRDDEGKVLSIHEKPFSPEQESLALDNPEIQDFLARCDRNESLMFLSSDLQLIRVIEDLVDILLSKNIINITDFPPKVIDKLMSRQSVRKRLKNASGMEFNNDGSNL